MASTNRDRLHPEPAPPVVDLFRLGQQLPSAAVDDHGAVVPDEGDALGAAVVAAVDAGGVLPEHVEAVVLEHRLKGVGRLGGVVRIGQLAPGRHDGLRRPGVHGEERDVDLVDAPVGHQAAGVVPEPPEVEVEAVGVERASGRGAEPHRVVHALRGLRVRLHRHRLHPALVGPDLDQADVAQVTRPHHLQRLLVVGTAALPLADLHHPVRSPGRGQHDVCLLDGVGEGLLHVNVLARVQGVDQHQAVPVVGGSDDHGVDVLVVQEPPVVAVLLRRLPLSLDHVLLAPVQLALIGVAQRHALHLVELQGRAHVGPAHAPDPDHAEADLVAGRDGLATAGEGLERRGETQPGRGQRGALEKLPAGSMHVDSFSSVSV
jgi:hypothetical protein